MDEYIKKAYTVAFRLTGDKKTACDLSAHAIVEVSGRKDLNKEISKDMIKFTALRVCALYLEGCVEPFFESNCNNASEIREAILGLRPECRIVIVWKDLLGYRLPELMQVTGKSITELNDELSHARTQIKKNLEMNMLQSSF